MSFHARSSNEKKPLNLKKLAVMAAFVAALLLVWTFVPVREQILAFAAWMAGLGAIGLAVYLVLYVAVTLSIGPAWAFSVAAGVAFGLMGIFLVLPSSLTAALAAFLLARHGLRRRVAPHIAERKRLDALDRAAGEHGVKVVVLLRLSPLLPFGVKSYLFGASRVRLRDYMIGTALGILPASTLYVSFGAAGRVAAEGGPQSDAEWALLAAGLAATAFVVWLLQRESTKKLREMGVG